MRVHHPAGERPRRSGEPDFPGLERPRSAEQMIGKRFSDFLTMAGPHLLRNPHRAAFTYAGLLPGVRYRHAGRGRYPLQMIANANERRDAERQLLPIGSR